jgi:hypothetical protein
VVSTIKVLDFKSDWTHCSLSIRILTILKLWVLTKHVYIAVFDEDFVFEVRPTTIGRRTLEVILYDFDAYSRHQSIGGVKLPLAHVDLSEKVTVWKGLSPCSEQDAKVSNDYLKDCDNGWFITPQLYWISNIHYVFSAVSTSAFRWSVAITQHQVKFINLLNAS